MLEKAQLEEVLAIALRHGGDFADIFLEKKKVSAVVCEEDKLERVVSGKDVGAGIRVISGESTSYAYTNDLSLASLKKVAEVVGRGAKGNQQDLQLDLRKAQGTPAFTIKQPPETIPMEEKAELVKKANSAARSLDKRVKQVTVSYADIVQEVTVANSLGVITEDQRTRTRFVVNTVAAEGETIQTGFESMGASMGFELFADYQVEEIATLATKRALLLLEAQPAPSGKMSVVLAGEAGGTMIHEACGHGLEADLAQKGLSVYAGKKGEEVASSVITVVDDGTIPNYYGSYLYDDEGVKAQKNVLIEKGELKEYMHDRLTAKQEKVETTGNGRRESFQCRPIPRMTNTYVAPGDTEPEEIIKQTKKGILVKRMGGGQVNTANGDYMFEVSEGYLIENGEVTRPVRGATLTGNGPETLKLVEMVGNDVGFKIGTCGKDGQGVPVTSGQPTMFIKELIVGGQGGNGENLQPYFKRR